MKVTEVAVKVPKPIVCRVEEIKVGETFKTNDKGVFMRIASNTVFMAVNLKTGECTTIQRNVEVTRVDVEATFKVKYE